MCVLFLCLWSIRINRTDHFAGCFADFFAEYLSGRRYDLSKNFIGCLTDKFSGRGLDKYKTDPFGRLVG